MFTSTLRNGKHYQVSTVDCWNGRLRARWNARGEWSPIAHQGKEGRGDREYHDHRITLERRHGNTSCSEGRFDEAPRRVWYRSGSWRSAWRRGRQMDYAYAGYAPFERRYRFAISYIVDRLIPNRCAASLTLPLQRSRACCIASSFNCSIGMIV